MDSRLHANHRKLPSLAWAPGALAVCLLAACASTPMGPTVQVLPAANKPFEVFQQEQEACKQYAQAQVGGQAEASNQRALGAGAIGTLLGASLGAALGGHQGAGVGAAAGAIVGGTSGANRSAYGQGSLQLQFNNAYAQCMYAKGNQLPGGGRTAYAAPQTAPVAPAAAVAVPAPGPVAVPVPGPVVVPAPTVVYVAPYYASPGPGWHWMFNVGVGWGWHHPVYGWR